MAHSSSAIRVFRDLHKTIMGLLTQAETSDKRAPEMTDGVIKELFMMMEVLFRLEDEFLLPALGTVGDPHAATLASDCGRSHAELRAFIHSLRQRSLDDEFYQLSLGNLVTTAREHLEKEEDEVYVVAEKLLAERFHSEEVYTDIEKRRYEIMAEPEFHDAQPGLVQNPRGGEQKRKLG